MKKSLALVIVGLVTMVCASFFVSHIASASSWLDSDLQTDVSDGPGGWSSGPSCRQESVYIGNKNMLEPVCFWEGQGFQHALITRQGVSLLVIRLPHEHRFHVVRNINSPTTYYMRIPSSPHLLMTVLDTNPFKRISYVVKDLRSKLIQPSDWLLSSEYGLRLGAIEPLFDPSDHTVPSVKSEMFSEDGKWVIAHVADYGMIRVNLQTFEKTWYRHDESVWYGGVGSALSNDGGIIVDSGDNKRVRVMDLSNCGHQSNVLEVKWRTYTAADDCPARDLADNWQQATGAEPLYQLYPEIDYDGGEIRLWGQYGDPDRPTNRWVTFRISDYQSQRLDYLALGDSYSSGEGDVEKSNDGRNHYLPRTDTGGDTCHVSSRSYPYLLRDAWGIPNDSMKSVACSGAQVVLDYNRPMTGYFGQGGRLASGENIDKFHLDALSSFMPGHVPQLEFIRKYKPKVITLTGGGNDIGFADMLAYCAYGSGNVDTNWEMVKEGFFGLFTCDYARANSLTQQLMLKAIDNQYGYTVSLLRKISAASPTSKVHLVGYPSFISEGTAVCTNSLELDSHERAAIHYYLKLLNNNLRRAADSQGVKYIDIEDSLIGGRLCEGSEYMTGVSGVDMKSEKSNMFHPNAKGHEKVATSITSQITSPIVQRSTPNRPSSIGEAIYNGQTFRLNVTNGDISASSGRVEINIPAYLFAAGSIVRIVLHSDPIPLGSLVVAADGSVTGSLSVSNLPPGFHLLTIEGESYSGESITAYQHVTVGLAEDVSSQSASEIENSSGYSTTRSVSDRKKMLGLPQVGGDTLDVEEQEYFPRAQSFSNKLAQALPYTKDSVSNVWSSIFIACGIMSVASAIYFIRKIRNEK